MGLADRVSSRKPSTHEYQASCQAKISPINGTQLQPCCRAFLPIESVDMGPVPLVHRMRHSEGFEAVSVPDALEQTTNAVTNVLRLLIVMLGVLTLSFMTIWVLTRLRLRCKRRHTLSLVTNNVGYEAIYPPSASGIDVFESDISIDMIAEDGTTHSSGTEFDDLSENGDLETIVSSASATRLNFVLDALPSIMKGGILERRGRKNTLQCDTSAYYEFDKVATSTGPPSAVQELKRSVTRPIFGFSFQEITPPVGSPLWNRKLDIPRTACIPGPLTHPPKFA